MNRVAPAIAMAACMALPHAARGQSVAAEVVAQSYSFGDPVQAGLSSVSLTWAPFSVSLPVGSFFSIDAAGGFARASVTGSDGDRAEVTGVTDTQVSLALLLVGGRFLVSVGGSVPSSLESQSLEEARVMGVLATELLPFAGGPWTGGGGFTVGAEARVDVGGLKTSMLGGFTQWSEREILRDGDLFYRPGNEARMRIVADARIGRASELSVLFGLQRFEADALSGANLFRSGTRVEGFVSYAFPVGVVGSGLLYGGARHHSRGEALGDLDWLPGLTNAPSRDLFLVGLDLRVARRGLVLRPAGQFRVLRGDQSVCFYATATGEPGQILCPSGQGWLSTVGTAVEVPLSDRVGRPRFVVAPAVRLRFGRAVNWGGRRDVVVGSSQPRVDPGSRIIGWEVGVTGRLEVAR